MKIAVFKIEIQIFKKKMRCCNSINKYMFKLIFVDKSGRRYCHVPTLSG